MKRLAAALLATAVWLGAGQAWAQEGSYAGVSFASVHYTEDGFPSADPSAIAFKLGWRLHRYLAVEARAGFGVGDDTVTYLGAPIDVAITHYFGVYGKGILPLSEGFAVYGLLGVIGGRVTAEGLGYRVESSDTGASYGVGFDIALGRQWGLTFEWAELFKDEGFKAQASSFGLTYRY